MHTSKHAHSSRSVLSHISPGIPTPSSGARDDLGIFLLIDAYLHCGNERECGGGWGVEYGGGGGGAEAPEAVKLEETGPGGNSSCTPRSSLEL